VAFAPYEFLQLIKESSYGTAMASPVAGTDSIYIRLAGANRFTVRPTPTQRKIQLGNGFATEGYRVSDQAACPGRLELELCYSQAKLLLDWMFTRVNVAQTSPWTTTEPAGDLASVTAYYGVMRDDGTIKRRRYRGGKALSPRLTSSAETGLVMLSSDLRFQKWDGNTVDATADPDATAFPAPADTAFPTDVLLHSHLAAGVTYPAALQYLESLELSTQNQLDVKYFTSHFPAFDRLRGRQSTSSVGVLYTASPDWRAVYEALTAQALQAVWGNGTHTVTLNYHGQNVIDSVGDDLTPGKVYTQTVGSSTLWDPSASADVTFTFT
jgi:hypothetical protein